MSKDVIDFSHISLSGIVDRDKGINNPFIVVSSSKFTSSIWFTETKFLEICTLFEGSNSDPLDYQLKRTIKGNPDEGRETHVGKAIRITQNTTSYQIEVFTQSYGESWKFNELYQVKSSLFEAYILVVRNTHAVKELEKTSKSPKNFSLGLD